MFLLFFLVMPTLVVADGWYYGLVSGGSSCSGMLVCQNFEDSGYDNSESWTESVGTNGIVDEDDTTATVLRGSQQLKIYAGDSGQVSATTKSYTASDEIWFHARANLTAINGSGDVIVIMDSGSTELMNINVQYSTDYVKGVCGSSSITSSTSVSPGNAIHIWGHYKKGTGTDAVYQIWIGTTLNRAEATLAVDGSNGTRTYQAAKIRLVSSYQNTNYYDQVIVDDEEFTTVSD